MGPERRQELRGVRQAVNGFERDGVIVGGAQKSPRRADSVSAALACCRRGGDAVGELGPCLEPSGVVPGFHSGDRRQHLTGISATTGGLAQDGTDGEVESAVVKTGGKNFMGFWEQPLTGIQTGETHVCPQSKFAEKAFLRQRQRQPPQEQCVVQK